VEHLPQGGLGDEESFWLAVSGNCLQLQILVRVNELAPTAQIQVGGIMHICWLGNTL
jgi:hypothetical protein